MKALIIFLIGYSCLVFGQDARADFKKINNVYNTTNVFAMDITYELFLDGSAIAHEVETGKYMKQYKNYYTLQANSEVIITDNFMYMIDKTAKIMAVDKKLDDKALADPLSLNLDSLFVLYSKIDEIRTNLPDIRAYRFYIKEGPYSICDVYFNAKTFFVTEIKNVFRDKIADEDDKERSAVLRTTFTNIRTGTISEPSVFNDSRYLKKVKEKYVLTENYRSYKFINHLN